MIRGRMMSVEQIESVLNDLVEAALPFEYALLISPTHDLYVGATLPIKASYQAAAARLLDSARNLGELIEEAAESAINAPMKDIGIRLNLKDWSGFVSVHLIHKGAYLLLIVDHIRLDNIQHRVTTEAISILNQLLNSDLQ